MNAIKEAIIKDGQSYHNVSSKANIELQLKKRFEGHLKFPLFYNKKIVGPINR